MEKKNFEDGENLLSEMNHVKEQIEKERFLDINNTMELRCKPTHVANYASHHEGDNNGRDKNMLFSGMQRSLRHFSGSSLNPNEEDVTLPNVELPSAEELPRSVTSVFTDRMDKGVSVNGKRPHYSVSSEEEKVEEQLSKDVDRFIWKIGQKYGWDDLVVLNALTKFLKSDGILERYTKLKPKKEESVGETSLMGVKSRISTKNALDRHFCRRCLIFGCNMHEKSQPEIKQRENIPNISENEDARRQCSEHCYLKVTNVKEDSYVVDKVKSGPYKIVFKRQKNVISDTAIWKPVEKYLYWEGVEIFGRNSCLIVQNLLSGLKTCLEVYNYMQKQDQCTVPLEHDKTTETVNKDKKKVSRVPTELYRAKARKYSRYPPALQNLANGEASLKKHYTPCTCESMCGDQCICLINGTCCEKYCGCPKNCNNRFRGCNCAKGECIDIQCPCFAASRECDPDLCKSCPLSCGDGSLGHETASEPSQCNNMKLLLNKHKKILIAKSDAHGWGAFAQDSLTKNDFLGEYTEELITEEEEGNKRRKKHNEHGTSYFLALNDQFEIDARRKGNKITYINHSNEPNCFAKVMIVRGDHRIGIFAGKDIEKGEELSLNYGYEPEQAALSRGHDPNIGPSS